VHSPKAKNPSRTVFQSWVKNAELEQHFIFITGLDRLEGVFLS